jgi:uncharacterized protein (DUF2267 family)
MSLDFTKDAATGNEMLNMLAEEMKISADKAGRILRAVLFALRSRISIDESLQIVAQLPLVLKGVYVDEWDPWHSFHRIHRVEEFITDLRRHDKTDAADLVDDQWAMRAVKTVFRTLSYTLSDQEFRNIISVLPHGLKEFVTRMPITG